MRKKRRIQRRKKHFLLTKGFWTSFFVLVLSGVSFYLFYFSPYFQIKETKVAGLETLSEEQVLGEINGSMSKQFSFLGNNLMSNSIFNSFKNLSSLLEEFPEIEGINVKKDFINGTVLLEIIEKQPFVVWCNDECVLLDKNATYIRNFNNEQGLIRIIEEEGFDSNLALWSGKTKKEFLEVVGQINQENSNITQFVVCSEYFKANLDDIDILFDLKENMDWQIEKMNIILEREDINDIQYIDLRFGDQAIIK